MFLGIKFNIWLSGRVILILTVSGLMFKIWRMLGRQLQLMRQTCLGRRGPGGGVVLGFHLDFDYFMI